MNVSFPLYMDADVSLEKVLRMRGGQRMANERENSVQKSTHDWQQLVEY